MVRINLINPRNLADQHLIAEYNETLMLLGYVRRYPIAENIPPTYRLGTGHVRFFKDKLLYLSKRHELIKKEMRSRGFVPTKTIDISSFPVALRGDWVASAADTTLIKQRLREKLRKKPEFYRYYGEHKPLSFFIELLDKK